MAGPRSLIQGSWTLPFGDYMQYEQDRIYTLPMDEIFVQGDFNCRGMVDPTNVMELARDIRARGLDVPIVVQPWTKANNPKIKFRLLAGFRRHMAHVINKAETIRCIVREDLSEVDARVLNLTENIQREDLNILQEARAIEYLKDAEVTQEEIAKRIGKSRGWVQDRVYLLELPDEIQTEAAAGTIGTKQIRQIWSLPSTQQQYEYIKRFKDSKLVQRRAAPKTEKIKRRNEKRLRIQTEIEELQDTIRDVLGNGLATQVLGWTVGYTSDLEIHQFIASECRKIGRFYAIPDGLSNVARMIPTIGEGKIKTTQNTNPDGLPWGDGPVGDRDIEEDKDLEDLESIIKDQET